MSGLKKSPRRRYTDKIRELADRLWARGEKEDSAALHDVAFRAEQRRKNRRS